MFSFRNKSRESFTLIELLVTLAIVAVLSTVVVVTLNPAELLKQARDSNRLSDLGTVNTALNLFSTDVTSGFMGTSTIIYLSIPSASPTCTGMGLPTLPSGYTYSCVTSQNLRNTDGTGWIPVNFQRMSSNSPISQLPIDPQNTTSTKYYTYVTGGSWKVMATPESQKYLGTAGADGGSNIGQFEVGNNMSLAPFTDGLAGWWKFDDTDNTTTTDSSGWGRSGTWFGTSTVRYSAGKVGVSAGNFNGSSDYINYWNYNDLYGSNDAISFSFWNKPNSSVDGGIIQVCHSIPYSSNAKLIKVAYGISGSTYDRVNSGNWEHVVMTNFGFGSSGGVSIYVNGVLVKSENVGRGNACGQPYIGASNAMQYFSGQIDDLRVYNRVLSAAEVAAIYDSTK